MNRVFLDILEGIFNTLGLKGALYFRMDFSALWGVTVHSLNILINMLFAAGPKQIHKKILIKRRNIILSASYLQ